MRGDEMCTTSVLREWQDQDHRTSLHLACELGLPRASELLVALLGTSIVAARDDLGSQPLHTAAQSGSLETVQCLLLHGAQASSSDRSGVAPMHFAASGGHTEIIKVLREHGASIEAQSVAGVPLHWAAGEGQTEAIKLLLELGVARDPLDADGFSPLGIAVVAGMEDVAILLLESGAKPSVSRLPNGLTLLHVAAELGMDVLAKKLLATPSGRSMATSETEGRLPIHVAAEHGNKTVVELLLPLSNLAEGTTADELIEAAMCSGEGWDSWDATESPFAMGSAMSISEGATLFHGSPYKNQQMATPCSALSSASKADFMSTTPITPPVPIAWPDEPRVAASTAEALAGASRSAARGDELVAENDLPGAFKAYTDAILFHGMDATLWGKRAGLQLMIAQSEGKLPRQLRMLCMKHELAEPNDRSCVLKAYSDAVVATELDPQSPLARRLLGKLDDAEVQFARARDFDMLSAGAVGASCPYEIGAAGLLEQRLLCGSGEFGHVSSPRYSSLIGKQSPRAAVRGGAARQSDRTKTTPVSPLRMQLKKLGRPQNAGDDQAVCSPLSKVRSSLRPMKLRI
eukprot:scaffold51699_cov39-Prasinocladus_malaysianus.AAC.4